MVFNRRHESVQTTTEAAPTETNVSKLPHQNGHAGGRSEKAGALDRHGLHPVAVPASTQSVIGNDLSIEGQSITIRCQGSLKVLGNIQADLHSRELEVGQEAVISGGISAENVDVFGRVSGAINGRHVILHAGSEVEGDIHSHLLSIEQGASFDGRSRRVRDPSEVTPQLQPNGLM